MVPLTLGQLEFLTTQYLRFLPTYVDTEMKFKNRFPHRGEIHDKKEADDGESGHQIASRGRGGGEFGDISADLKVKA